MRHFETEAETREQADREASSQAAKIVSQSKELELVLYFVIFIVGLILKVLGIL